MSDIPQLSNRRESVHFFQLRWRLTRSGEWGDTSVCHAHRRRRGGCHIGSKKSRDNVRVRNETGGADLPGKHNKKPPPENA